MINVDLRRYGNDPEYAKMINGYISGADIDESKPSIYKLLPDKPSIYKLLPNHEMDRTTILQNRIDPYPWEKEETNDNA